MVQNNIPLVGMFWKGVYNTPVRRGLYSTENEQRTTVVIGLQV